MLELQEYEIKEEYEDSRSLIYAMLSWTYNKYKKFDLDNVLQK